MEGETKSKQRGELQAGLVPAEWKSLDGYLKTLI